MTTIYTYSSLRLQWIIDDAVLTRTTWSSVRMWYMVGTKKREVEVTRSGSTFAASLAGPLDAGVYNCYLDFEGSGEVQYEEQVQSAFRVTTLQAEAENADGSTVTVVLEGDHARASSVVVEEPETQVTELMPNRMQRLYRYSTATLVWDLSKELAARPELGSLRASFAYRVGGKPSVETSAWITGAKAYHTLSNPMVDGVYSCYVRWYGNDGNVVFEAQSLQAFMVCREQGETLNPDGGAVTVNIAQSKVRQVVTIPLEEGADDLSESKLPILYTYGNVNIVWDLSREVNVRPELRGMALEFVCQTDSSVRTEDVSWNGDKVEASLAGPVEAGVWSCFLRFKNGGKTELLMTVLQAWQSAEMQGAVLNPDGATVTLNLRSGRVLNTVITPLVDPTDIVHLGDLMDVDLKSHVPQAGEVLKCDGRTWVSGSVAWNEVSGKPAWLTPEVPDLSAFGNRAGYIKGVTSDMVTGALGYTPLKSVGWTDVADKPEWLTMTMPDLGDFGNMAGYIKRNEINETVIVDALGYSPKELTGYLRLLNDVDVSDAQDGYALVYNSAAGMWRPGLVKGGGGGVDPTIYLTKSEAESKYLTKDEFGKWFSRYDYRDGSGDWAIGAKKDFFSLKGVAAYGPFKYDSGGEGGEGGVSSFAALSEVIGAGAPESYPKYWGMKDAETYGWMDAKGVGNFAELGDIHTPLGDRSVDNVQVWAEATGDYGWYDASKLGKTYTGDGTYIKVEDTKISFMKTLGTAAYKDETYFEKAITNKWIKLWGSTEINLGGSWDGIIKLPYEANISMQDGNNVWQSVLSGSKGSTNINYGLRAHNTININGKDNVSLRVYDGSGTRTKEATLTKDGLGIGIDVTPKASLHVLDRIRIGAAILEYDTDKNALKITTDNNNAMHLYATGGISAYSYGASSEYKGDTVEWYQYSLDKKVQIAEIIINGNPTAVYAPSGGASKWEEIEGRPTLLSQFTNDGVFITANDIPSYTLGTSGNYITLKKDNSQENSIIAPYATNAGTATYLKSAGAGYEDIESKHLLKFTVNAAGGHVATQWQTEALKNAAINKYIQWYNGGYMKMVMGNTIAGNVNQSVDKDALLKKFSLISNGDLGALGSTYIANYAMRGFYIQPDSNGNMGGQICLLKEGWQIGGTLISFSNSGQIRMQQNYLAIGNWMSSLTPKVPTGTVLSADGKIYTTTGITIGGAYLSWDSTNNALKISDINGGGQMHLYTTGGVAAYSSIGNGFGTLSNLSLSDSLSVSNKITTNGLSANTIDTNTLTAKTQLTIGTDALGKVLITPKKRSSTYQGILVDGFISVGEEFPTQESAGYKLNTTTLYVKSDLKVGEYGTGIKNIQVKTPSDKTDMWLCFTVGTTNYGLQLTIL